MRPDVEREIKIRVGNKFFLAPFPKQRRRRIHQYSPKFATTLTVCGRFAIVVCRHPLRILRDGAQQLSKADSSSVVSEIPKDSGLGELLRTITQDAQWVPAYNDGKPTAGQINVVANFGEY